MMADIKKPAALLQEAIRNQESAIASEMSQKN